MNIIPNFEASDTTPAILAIVFLFLIFWVRSRNNTEEQPEE